MFIPMCTTSLARTGRTEKYDKHDEKDTKKEHRYTEMDSLAYKKLTDEHRRSVVPPFQNCVMHH